MNQSPQLDQLFTALAKAQGEMTAAAKDCANPFFKSRYADLSSVWTACREPLSKNGLSVLQIVQSTDLGDVLHTTLGHSSGQYMTSTMPIRIKAGNGGNELQALGAAITYLRRFALSAIVGVAPDDDNDGNGSQYKAAPSAVKQPHSVDFTPQSSGKPAPLKPSSENNYVPFASEFQVEQIRLLLEQCDDQYYKKVMEWLSSQKVDQLHKLTLPLFDKVKTRVEDHLAKNSIHDAIMEE